MEWQPIETAPKGVLLIVFTPKQVGDHADTIRLEFDMIDPDSDDYWVYHGEHYEHYISIACSDITHGPKERAPYTHWMPIPEPPNVKK